MKMNKIRRRLPALLLVAAFLVAATIPLSAAAAGETGSITLTADVESDANVVVDLYLVGEPAGRINEFTAAAGFEDAQEALDAAPDMSNEEYQEMACLLLEIADASDLEPAYADQPIGQKIDEIPAGLYLTVPHSLGTTDYIVTDNETGYTQSQAVSASYTYSFLPELLAIPDNDGSYNLNSTLKFSMEERFLNLEIIKTLETYEVSRDDYTLTPATFLFDVEAYSNADRTETVYSNIISITFGTAEQESYVLADTIPVGSYVVVTEVYSGASYSLVSDESLTFDTAETVPADRVLRAEFTNDYTGSRKTGGAVVNSFSYVAPDDNDPNWHWSWTSKYSYNNQ